jgi:hypothetical protein
LRHVVAVNRADVGKAQFFEQGAATGHARYQLTRTPRAIAQGAGKGGFKAGRQILERGQRGIGLKAGQIFRQRADGGRDAHVIVIQDHEQALFQVACGIHRLIGHASGDRAVADHGNRIAGGLAHITAHGKAKGGGDRGGRMGGPEGVVFGFGPFGETGKATALAQGAHAVAAACQNFMRIALVAHVPDQLIRGRVEHGVDGDRQFHHTQR